MASVRVQNTHISHPLRDLHDSLLDIVGAINGPHRDATILEAAGVRLDRALFPVLVLVERIGPVGVVDVADRVGRDYTTVSRQMAKLETLGLIIRREGDADRRVREAVIAPSGKAMTDRIDAARERLLRAAFADWESHDLDTFVVLMRRFADAFLPEPSMAAADPVAGRQVGEFGAMTTQPQLGGGDPAGHAPPRTGRPPRGSTR